MINDVFADNSLYFHNALVRVNYNDLTSSIHATTKYPERFFEKPYHGQHNELKNRTMHIDYADDADSKSNSIKASSPKYQFDAMDDTSRLTLHELAVFKHIAKIPSITQNHLISKTGLSIATIKRSAISLQEEDFIRRMNGKRNSKWEVLVKTD